MEYCFYRSTVIGDGSRLNPFRSKICNYIVGQPDGQNYWEWLHRARPIRFGLAYCDSVVHDTLQADTDIKALSPKLADKAALDMWLGNAHSDLDSNVKTLLENDGINLNWIAQGTSKKEIFRYLARIHVLTQYLRRLKDDQYQEFFRRNLDATVSQLPLAVRNKMRTWMENRGLATAWITNQTSVRAVIQYIVDGLSDYPVMRLGPVEF